MNLTFVFSFGGLGGRRWAALGAAAALLLVTGCSSDDDPDGHDDHETPDSGEPKAGRGASGAGGGSPGKGGAGGGGPSDAGLDAAPGDGAVADSGPEPTDASTPEPGLYAYATTVFSSEGATTYVSVLTSLDITELSNDDAREYPGWATIGAAGGRLLIGDGETPIVTGYDVADDGALEEVNTVSFANFGATGALYDNIVISPTKAYMAGLGTERVVWDPSELLISGTVDTTDLEAMRGDLELRISYDRGAVVRGDRAFQTLFWSDADRIIFDPGSQIMIFDTEADELAELLDAPCPNLDVATQDEAGNLYFSNWVFSLTAPLLDENAPKNCFVSIKAGEEQVDEESITHFADITEGREAGVLRYLEDGKALLAVYHHERIDLETADPADVGATNDWRFWIVDLESKSAEQLEGIEWFGGGYHLARLSGRLFVLVPEDEYSNTVVYEITDDFTAERRFETPGWAYQMVQIR